MTVRTYYGTELVTVPDKLDANGLGIVGAGRLPGVVSGTAGGRVVVALDEPSQTYPINSEDGSMVPGKIAEVLERDLQFRIDGDDSGAPSFSPEQLEYLKRTYPDAATPLVQAEIDAQPQETKAFENDGSEDDDAAAAAAQLGVKP